MRWLVGRDRRGRVQYKVFAGDQGWKGLIRHWHMLHGACLNERACWELLSVAPWKGLPGVDGKPVGRHRGNCV